MKRIIRLTESDLTRIVKRVIKEQETVGGGGNVKNLPEVKVSAWAPLDVAKQKAKSNNSNILLYVYNDGCVACEGYAKNIMSDQRWKELLTSQNLILSKIVMCVKGDGSYPVQDESGKTTGIGNFTPCDDNQLSVWNSSGLEQSTYAVPAVLVLSSDGKTIVEGPFYGKNGFQNLYMKMV